MLTKQQIARLESLDGWEEFVSNSSDWNKKKLLEMARNGEERPNQHIHPLGDALCRYTNPNSGCYDPEFDKAIRKLHPDWFVDTVSENKKKLLEIAKNGDPFPSKNKPESRAFRDYVSPLSGSYDAVFTKEIGELRPNWLHNAATKNKKQLLTMAKNGDKRSPATSVLGGALCRYLNPKSNCYDVSFAKEIKLLRPDWFDKVSHKKQQLLEMARNGKKRPVATSVLGDALCRYVNLKKNCYDALFTKKIKALSHWLVKTSVENKKQLLKIAKSGKKKPIQSTLLGSALGSYLRKSHHCYDPKFDKAIRKLRPDWFKK